MSLFQSLFPLARENALTVLIVAEGDQLRVNVMPKSKDEKTQKTLYPLSLLGSPEELDRDFAEAVQIYSPGSQSVLEQARAAGAANGSTTAAPALPAPDAAAAPDTTRRKPGPKPKNAALPAPAAPSDAAAGSPDAGEQAGTDAGTEADPRQIGIPGLDGDSVAQGAGNESNAGMAAESGAPAAESTEAGATAAASADDGAVDLW